MTRGTFANVRIRNLMVPGVEGGVTVHQPHGEQMSDLRRRDQVPGGGRSARSSSPARSTAPAARATGRRRERACSACAPSSRRASSASTARTSSAWASSPASSRTESNARVARPRRHRDVRPRPGSEAGVRPRGEVTLDDPPRRRHASRRSRSASRIDTPIEVGLLPARRHPAVRAAAAGRLVTARYRLAILKSLDMTASSLPPAAVPRRLLRAARGPGAGLDDAAGRALPSGVPRGPPPGVFLRRALPRRRPRGRGLAAAVPPLRAGRRHLLLRHPGAGRRRWACASSSEKSGPKLSAAGPDAATTSSGCAASIPPAELRFTGEILEAPAVARSATRAAVSGSPARRGRWPRYLVEGGGSKSLRRRSSR